jgi:hypothetical protein
LSSRILRTLAMKSREYSGLRFVKGEVFLSSREDRRLVSKRAIQREKYDVWLPKWLQARDASGWLNAAR